MPQPKVLPPNPASRRFAIGLVVALVLVVALALLSQLACRSQPEQRVGGSARTEKSAAPDQVEKPQPSPELVGRQSCRECHQRETEAWQGSHHARSMNVATASTILSDATAPVPKRAGEPAASVKAGGESFSVTTIRTEGRLDTFTVRYTFGIEPLQQYLVDGPRGRLQALRLAWDTRPESDGGQRWFHLHAGQDIPPGDLLHFLGPNQNYNGMCADCHSTGLRRGYSPEEDSFRTSWSEIEVSCEACHGPASRHLAWARQPASKRGKDSGFVRPLRGASVLSWSLGEGKRIAEPRGDASRQTEIDSCAPCHSRRTLLAEAPGPPNELLDLVAPEFALAPLYYGDGQVRDEVYVWGSFTQSKMHRAGVTCGNCHEPHSGVLRAEGQALCAQCHEPRVFSTIEHMGHEESRGVECVDCHMPETTYMEVDARRDHSFRIPRPDLTLDQSVPNACSACHEDQGSKWILAEFEKVWGKPKPEAQALLVRGQAGDPSVVAGLLSLSLNSSQPIMQRATALVVASSLPARSDLRATISRLVSDPEPLLRLAAATATFGLPPGDRVALASRSLRDRVFAVRVEALRVLALGAQEQDRGSVSDELRRVADEFIQAQRPFLDRAIVRVQLAGILRALGRLVEAEAHLVQALKLDPNSVPAAVNYADLLRTQGREGEVLSLLDALLTRVPDAAAAWYSRGLSLVRAGRRGEAIESLHEAFELEPANPGYTLAYALALEGEGRDKAAILALDRGLSESPWAAQLHQLRVELLRRPGDNPRLRSAIAVWLERLPEDRAAIAAASAVIGAR